MRPFCEPPRRPCGFAASMRAARTSRRTRGSRTPSDRAASASSPRAESCHRDSLARDVVAIRFGIAPSATWAALSAAAPDDDPLAEIFENEGVSSTA